MQKSSYFLAGAVVAVAAIVVYQFLTMSQDTAIETVDSGGSTTTTTQQKKRAGMLGGLLGGGEATEEQETTAIESGYVYGNATITTDGTYRYIKSNGIPTHETGEFPNSGNPNAISEQDHEYRVLLQPQYQAEATPVQVPGVALNGIPLEPGTAEFYNRDRSSGWSEEAFYKGHGLLGIDLSNAHVQPDGTYHYHAVPNGLLEQALADQSGDLIQLAWAADGVPIYFSQSHAYVPSYQLKSGTRPGGSNAPSGAYDGKYTQDWEYADGLGDLDDCNGITIEGQYLYIITLEFPYIPRCVHGNPDPSFAKGPGAGANGGTQRGTPPGQPPQDGRFGGPPLQR